MKIRYALPVVFLLLTASACGGSSTSSDSSISDSTVATAKGPESNSEFCKNALAMQTAGQEALTAVENKTLDAKGFWVTAADLAAKLLKDAPAEISKEAEISGNGVIKLVALLKKIDYNFELLSSDKAVVAEFEKISSDPAYETANNAVDKYLEESCGIPQGS